MNMQIDWREELDSSFGDGTNRPPADYLAPGRAALRKRRTAMGATALATVLVVGGIGWAAMPDGSTRAVDGQVATNSATPSDNASPAADVPIRAVSPDSKEGERLLDTLVDIEGAGLIVLEGTTVLQTVGNPLGYKPPQSSIGVVAEKDGVETWMLLTGTEGRSTNWLSDAARKRHATFEDWLADQVAYQQGAREKSPAYIEKDGAVAPYANVEILEQVLAPPEAAAYGPIEDAAAVKVRMPTGEVRFAIIHRDGDSTILDPAVLEAPTMAAFLAHLQAQGESGEGLR